MTNQFDSESDWGTMQTKITEHNKTKPQKNRDTNTAKDHPGPHASATDMLPVGELHHHLVMMNFYCSEEHDKTKQVHLDVRLLLFQLQNR